MAKQEGSPAYLMYPSDILSSGRVAALSDREELWYRRALDLGWEHGGMPADPAEFAGWVGRKCTAAGAEKIIAKFYVPHKRDAAKVVNPRQEKERTLFNKKRKQKSEAGKRGMRNRWKQTGNDDNTVITEDNIPIPISIPIPKNDLKRLINACVRENSTVDPKAVEAGVYYTLLQRNGATDPINSLAYFRPQIERVASESADLKDSGWKSLLTVRREQVMRSKAVTA